MSREYQILRFVTLGSVDDGKSTLIGRLLYDSNSVFKNQVQSIEQASVKKGKQNIDFSLFTDGLREERSQGITIDVAYKYFNTSKRKFIIIDAPGHFQFIKNMITGASEADVALILIDITKGISEQTKRHVYIASILKIPNIIVCINKMDLVNYSEKVFNKAIDIFNNHFSELEFKDVRFIPVSALKGDNIVSSSPSMKWFNGKSVLSHLETIELSNTISLENSRLPIQATLVYKDVLGRPINAFLGKISSGVFSKNDNVTLLPSGITTQIKDIKLGDKTLDYAYAPMSVSVTLKDELAIQRGDLITHTDNQPKQTTVFKAILCWLGEFNYKPVTKYIINHTSRQANAIVKEIDYKLNIENLAQDKSVTVITTNDICGVTICTDKALCIDNYQTNKTTGSFILIDQVTNETVAAGMITD